MNLSLAGKANGSKPWNFDHRDFDSKRIAAVTEEAFQIESGAGAVDIRHGEDQLGSLLTSMLVDKVSAGIQDDLKSLLPKSFAARLALNERFGLPRQFSNEVDSSIQQLKLNTALMNRVTLGFEVATNDTFINIAPVRRTEVIIRNLDPLDSVLPN